MKFQLKLLTGSVLSLFVLSCSAFEVKVVVKDATPQVRAVGFSVNGKSYGGFCCRRPYSKSGMSPGNYSFGLRLNKLIGGDNLACTKNGKAVFPLAEDSTVVLIYNKDNNRCTVQTEK